MKTDTKSEYDQQAETFLAKHGLKFRATLSDSKTPAWKEAGERHGHHYRVTISGDGNIPSDYPVRPLEHGDEAKDKATCGECGRSWDDAICTSMTPAPSARCPFEYFHGEKRRLTFDFWGSIKDAKTGKEPSAYDVLACISGDVHCADTFADFCAEFGYEQDSIKALQTFRRCSAFAKRLQAFFTAKELEDLAEIS